MQQVSSSKRFLKVFVGGALLGSVLASWIAPMAITWMATPSLAMNRGFDCAGPIDSAMGYLKMWQAIGFGIGGILGLILYFTVFNKKKNNLENPQNF